MSVEPISFSSLGRAALLFGDFAAALFLGSILILAHRAWRDERHCRAKYGELWAAYRRPARFRMIPFLY
jgi:hypothetical protein